MFKKVSFCFVSFCSVCFVGISLMGVPEKSEGELTVAPKVKRVSRATVRNELIDTCEAFAHTLIAEVSQVSSLFERYACKKKKSDAAHRTLVCATEERCAALQEVLQFLGDTTTLVCKVKVTEGCAAASGESLVCAQSCWMQALAQVQERLLTEVRLLLEQDGQSHFNGLSKDELRKAKGSIESFMSDSEQCVQNLMTELSPKRASLQHASQDDQSTNNQCKED